MPRDTRVLVRDVETGHEYTVPEARYRRTPHLWERVGPERKKSKTTVDTSAAKNKAAIPAPTTSDSSDSDTEAGSTATQKEND